MLRMNDCSKEVVMKTILMIAVLVVALPILARDKKAQGEILKPREFAKVQSYCIDQSGLSGPDRYLVTGFVETESKPKHLLTKMPWRLTMNCRDGDPDASVRLEFVPLNETRIAMGEATPQQTGIVDACDPEAKAKVVLTVDDVASLKLLYRVQAMPITNTSADSPLMADPVAPAERRDALYTAFWTLIQDIQRLDAKGAK